MTIMNKTMKRLLSLILALTFCFALALQVSAETEGEVTEAAAEAEVTVLTQDDLNAALNELLQNLDGQQTIAYGNDIAMMNAPANVRQDVVDAVELCTRCLVTAKKIQTQAAALKQKVMNSTGLDDLQKETIITNQDNAIMKVEFFPVEHLITQMQGLTEGGMVSTDEMNNYLMELEEVEAQLNTTENMLRATELLPAMDSRLAMLKASLGTVGEGSGVMEETLILELNEFARRREEIGKALEGFLSMPAQEQQTTLDQINELSQELENYPTQALMNTVRYADSVAGELDMLEASLAQSQSKMIFGIIALILAGIAIVMAIVVAVFALGKARGEQVDLSVYASRGDVDAVSRQNKQLKMHNDQQGMRIEAILREVEQLKARSVVEMPRQDAVKAEKPVAAPVVEAPKPEKPILGSSQPLCNLKMNYQFVNPANSYLTEQPSGKLILFADETLEVSPDEMNMTNELSGWVNNGLFYLFEVEVNGKILDPQRDALPAGYYYITKTLRRAVVKNMGNGSYVIQSKGLIVMSK